MSALIALINQAEQEVAKLAVGVPVHAAPAPSSAASYRTWPGKDASQTCIASNARARRVLATRSHAPRDRRKAAEEGVTVLTRASTPRR